jgi:hypothetical protein
MFCVVMVRDVQPEIRPEVTGKVWESLKTRGGQPANNPPSQSSGAAGANRRE